MVKDKWRHVGGGIVMCEFFSGEHHYPGCNLLARHYPYNELCCSTFGVLLNQRMRLLFPDDAHYADEIEKSVYNMLAASLERDRGYRYLGYLEGSKDSRYTDIATCCAGTGARLAAMLPQFLYACTDDSVYVDLYADSRASVQGSVLEVKTGMPYRGNVEILLERWAHRRLKLRIPSWCAEPVSVNGVMAAPGTYLTLENLKSGAAVAFSLPFGVRSLRYSGRDEAVRAGIRAAAARRPAPRRRIPAVRSRAPGPQGNRGGAIL
jgi:DUF1680 family protein